MPGRNDPCPCCSGKKYKQCCLKAEQAQPEDDFLWRRIRRAIEGSPSKMLGFSSDHFGQEGLLEAWDEFMPWDDESFLPDTPHMPIFMPWFFFNWLPDPRSSLVKRASLDGLTLGQAYLNKKGRQLDPLYRRYVEQCCATPFSFYDVIEVTPGTGFVLRDIFTGEEANITEHSGSHYSTVGDIMFAKLVHIDQVTMLEACSSIIFPPMEKGAILDLRKKINRRNSTITPEVLKEYFYDMLGIYHDIADRLPNPMMPRLQNTDGEDLLMHELHYELICTPREALDILRQLNPAEDDERILSGAEFNTEGELTSIKFAWAKAGNKKHKSWNNTILGHLNIEGSRLTVEVNSENRAEQFKTIMSELMQGKSRYKTTVIESPQVKLEQLKNEEGSKQPKQRQKEQEEFNSLPEVQAQIAEYMSQYYRDWLNQKIPVLKNKTPLQAVKTKDGREMVEALLIEFERRGEGLPLPLDAAIIAEMREKLGLS